MIDLAVAALAFGLAAPGQVAAPDEEIVVRGAPEAIAPTGSRVAIEALLAGGTATDPERYLAAHFLYQTGAATGDHALREQALERMLETASMPQAERTPALRTLVAFALQSGDRVEAARRLEQLVALDGEDSRSRGNLAALYSEAGRPPMPWRSCARRSPSPAAAASWCRRNG